MVGDLPSGWAILLGAAAGGGASVLVQALAQTRLIRAQRMNERADHRLATFARIASLRYIVESLHFKTANSRHQGQLFTATDDRTYAELKYGDWKTYHSQFMDARAQLNEALAAAEVLFRLDKQLRKDLLMVMENRSSEAKTPPAVPIPQLAAWHDAETSAERTHFKRVVLDPLDRVIAALREQLQSDATAASTPPRH